VASIERNKATVGVGCWWPRASSSISVDIGRFEDGKLVEHSGIAYQMGLLLFVGFDPRAAAPATGGKPRG